MDPLEEIEDQLRKQQEFGLDPITAAASEIHRARRQYADALKTIDQYSEMISKQSETISWQVKEISKLKTELDELRAKNPA